MANETQCIILNMLHNVTQFTINTNEKTLIRDYQASLTQDTDKQILFDLLDRRSITYLLTKLKHHSPPIQIAESHSKTTHIVLATSACRSRLTWRTAWIDNDRETQHTSDTSDTTIILIAAMMVSKNTDMNSDQNHSLSKLSTKYHSPPILILGKSVSPVLSR